MPNKVVVLLQRKLEIRMLLTKGFSLDKFLPYFSIGDKNQVAISNA